MKLLEPRELVDSPILITTCDPGVRSPHDPEPISTLQRSIKAHCILGGSVTLPTEHILTDSITAKAIAAMPELLKAGLLVPDVPVGYTNFSSFVRSNTIHSDLDWEHQSEAAAFLDEHAKHAILYIPADLSVEYARTLLRSLILAKLQKRVQIPWPALRRVSEEWLTTAVVGTDELKRCRRLITRGHQLFDHNAALLYHLVGATATSSSPLLPDSLESSLSALMKSLNSGDASRDGMAKFINTRNKQDLTTLLESAFSRDVHTPILRTAEATTATRCQFTLLELLDAFSLDTALLDHLNCAAVIEIATSPEAKRARRVITDVYMEAAHEMDANRILKLTSRGSAEVKATFRNKIHEVVRAESTRTRRFGQVTRAIGWGSVALGVATVPLSGPIGMAMSIGGVLLSASGSSLDQINQSRTKPLLTLLEKMQDKALSK